MALNQLVVVSLILGLSFAPAQLIAQTKKSPAQQTPALGRERDIADLRQQVATLKDKVTSLESTLSLCLALLKDKQDRSDSVTLDMNDHAYGRLDMDNGFLLVSVQEVTPYLDGYKVGLSIGNPLSASFAGFTAKVKWGKKYDYTKYTSESFDEWQKGIQEKEVSFSNILQSGSWNKVELVLTPATAPQLGYVTLSITTNTVRLHTQ
ncbi:MAG TPA: DUF3251 domain-containing protein [Terriglobales bacterium]|nr:DUF3251 domain-containing protein [Terriglobales bacterium]